MLVETFSKEKAEKKRTPVGRNYIASFSLSEKDGRLSVISD
ncbi:hypothetical protein [Brenneria tiliae]